MGKSRTYESSGEQQAEERRTQYIQGRQARSGTQGQGSNAKGEVEKGHDDSEACRSHDNDWGSGFQPRERVETVRNCAALPRDFIDGVVLRVANALLGLTKDEDGGVPDTWNRGGT